MTNNSVLEKDEQEFVNEKQKIKKLVNLSLECVKDEIVSTEDEIVKRLNKKHAAIHTDQFYILTEKPHSLYKGIDFTLETKQSFINTYENQTVIIDNKQKNIARMWLASQERRQFWGITFDPTKTTHSNGLYNIWKGFGVEALAGNCELFKKHIQEVICDGNQEYFNYVWKWLAHLVQNPDKLSPVLVLMGEQGVGKNTFVDPIGEIFGTHYLPLDNINQFLGNFNFHLKNAVLLHGNEAVWGGNKQALGRLKAMVTEKDCVIEGKGKDQIRMRNYKHLILSSNEDWPVHLERDARRFLVLNVSNKYKDNRSYFRSIRNELEAGGLKALLYELLHENIAEYDPWFLPQNTEAFGVKLLSAQPSERYIYEALFFESFDLGNATPSRRWGNTISCNSVYEDYQIWCQKQSYKPQDAAQLGKILRKLVPAIIRERGTTGQRLYHYELPDINIAKEQFQHSFRVDSSIWENLSS